MATLNTCFNRGLWVAALAGGLLVACQGPDEFFRNGGGANGVGGGAPATGGATGSGGVHASGGSTGSGGVVATGGTTATGGARATGGVTGTGGVTSTGGTPATGGITGAGGVTSTGGGTGTGGVTTTGGTTGAAGTRGSGGTTATGGATGAAGSTGAAGTTGGGTGPCAGLCSNPTAVAPNANSGDLGTGATCNDVVGSVTHLVCGNFLAPRAFSVNGKAVDCATGGTFTLPAPVNGGFCMQAGAGQHSYAYFTTY